MKSYEYKLRWQREYYRRHKRRLLAWHRTYYRKHRARILERKARQYLARLPGIRP